MEDKNISYNKLNDDMIQPADISAKDYAMDVGQRKKEIYEQMKREVEVAQQQKEQLMQEMKDDDMNRSIENYKINEFGEIERPSKTR